MKNRTIVWLPKEQKTHLLSMLWPFGMQLDVPNISGPEESMKSMIDENRWQSMTIDNN